ncbi:uncharacterized protein TRIADDRAFT_21157 [Trichoplax adhaerens]|uniref:Rab-GAP TBC domain-containing protein n=1 Tax=Trichoplax adhaerens TaxID=10228 RepID=B3RPD6_TRIAD|nr:hypothetical protein TRIADDRAFT_21157 [Trichoplax adhaerens]EDV27616.1 hypothetical protein TRIADDRAFT_21157 [Trichoplax adhaerens]|eukprot:XP_002109450.1 hypothetical protein TRIADDRAFT_21157 [Trichoplax adhaerens]
MASTTNKSTSSNNFSHLPKRPLGKVRTDNSLFWSEEYIEGDPIDLWGRVIADWDDCLKKRPKYIKKLVRYNIPQPLRCLLWQLLSGADKQRYLIEGYADLLKETSPHEKTIRRDIDRTYPDHPKFSSPNSPLQESMLNIMKAYSLYDKEVGYCQGNAFIAGLLLLEMPEEEAFAVFVQIMRKYNMRELCKPNMAELAVCMYQLECLIEELLPDLHVHFQAQGFRASVYASSWFLTLFASTVSPDLATRIMDFVLAEGLEFIFRLSLAILSVCNKDLLKLDIEGMIMHFQKELTKYDSITVQVLFDMAFTLKITPKKLKKLEKDYHTRKAKETGDVELMKVSLMKYK